MIRTTRRLDLRSSCRFLFPQLFVALLSASILSAANVSFKSEYLHRTVYTEGEFTNWHQGEASYEILSSHEFGKFELGLHLSAFRPNGAMIHKADSSQPVPEDLGVKSGNLYGRAFYLDQWNEAAMSLTWLDGIMGVSASIREQEGERNEWSVAGTLQPVPIINMTLKRGLKNPLPEFSEASYEYFEDDSSYVIERRRINWRTPLYYERVTLSIGDSSSFWIVSDYFEAGIHPAEPVVGESPEKSLLGVVDGFWQDERVEAQGMIGHNAMMTLGIRRIFLDSRLRLYDGGRRFGYYGIADFSIEYWYAKTSFRRWSLLYGHGYGHGDLAGSVQLWPFLEGILRYLGERRHLIARAGGDWNFGRLDYRVDKRGRFQMLAGLDWLRIEPFFTMVNWRPLLFGFGVDDLRSVELKLHRADLARIRLNPVLKFGYWELHAAVSQWVPISIVKESGDDGGEGSEPPAPEQDDKATIWGGFSASLSLQLMF